MSKKTKTGLVPKFRFPEFRKFGEWDCLELNEFLIETKQRNRTLMYGSQHVLSVSGEYGCVNQIEFMGRSYAGASVKDYHVVEKGDIVYTKSPLKKNPFGIIRENKGDAGIVSTLYAVYRTNDRGCSAYFDQYFSSDHKLNCYLQPLVRKGAKNDMKVNNYAVLSGKIVAPKLKEQRKIADCLSSLDDLIAAENRKLDVLKTHKKGLMQKLFPTDGKAIPELRFPEFKESPNWQENYLGDIGAFYKGKGVSKADIEENGITKCIRYGELYTQYGEVIDKVYSKTNIPRPALFLSCKNDVIIPSSGETKIDIATASCVQLDDIALGGDINVIRTQTNGVF